MNKEVIDYVEQFCEVLRTNYQSYVIEMHRNAIANDGIVDENYVDYHKDQIDKLSMGENVDEFVYVMGRKYAKIIHITKPGNQKSAHAFVDMNTGDVMKAASWKAPAKGIRYNLLDDKSRQEMYLRAEWSGQYLYAR